MLSVQSHKSNKSKKSDEIEYVVIDDIKFLDDIVVISSEEILMDSFFIIKSFKNIIDQIVLNKGRHSNTSDFINLIFDSNAEDDNLITFDVEDYFSDIFKSYQNNWNEVWVQFFKDFPRQTTIFNSKEYSSTQELLSELYKYKSYSYEVGEHRTNLFLLIIMLLNQSTYGFMCEVMYYLFGDVDKFRHVSSRNLDKTINITVDRENNSFRMDVTAEFNILDVRSEEVLDKLVCESNIEGFLELESNRIKFSPKGIILWHNI